MSVEYGCSRGRFAISAHLNRPITVRRNEIQIQKRNMVRIKLNSKKETKWVIVKVICKEWYGSYIGGPVDNDVIYVATIPLKAMEKGITIRKDIHLLPPGNKLISNRRGELGSHGSSHELQLKNTIKNVKK